MRSWIIGRWEIYTLRGHLRTDRRGQCTASCRAQSSQRVSRTGGFLVHHFGQASRDAVRISVSTWNYFYLSDVKLWNSIIIIYICFRFILSISICWNFLTEKFWRRSYRQTEKLTELMLPRRCAVRINARRQKIGPTVRRGAHLRVLNANLKANFSPVWPKMLEQEQCRIELQKQHTHSVFVHFKFTFWNSEVLIWIIIKIFQSHRIIWLVTK